MIIFGTGMRLLPKGLDSIVQRTSSNGKLPPSPKSKCFQLDSKVIYDVCNLYDADGLYIIDATKHSPLIGFAYDGFPIYGAFGYKNLDGTGGIVRMKSSFKLRNITTRTVYADGTDVTDGPAVSTTYPLGYFREYEFIAPSSGQTDYLDVHNGRFCVASRISEWDLCLFLYSG